MDYAKRLQAIGCKPPSKPADRRIEAIEAGIGIPLPSPYRSFLADFGGWWGDICCPCREPTPFGEHWLNGFHDAREVLGLLDSQIAPRNMVTIGWGHFAKYTCLSVAGIDRGAIYALDGESRAYWTDEVFRQRFNAMAEEIANYLAIRREDRLPEKPIGYDNLYLLAKDFDEFLGHCRADEEGG